MAGEKQATRGLRRVPQFYIAEAAEITTGARHGLAVGVESDGADVVSVPRISFQWPACLGVPKA